VNLKKGTLENTERREKIAGNWNILKAERAGDNNRQLKPVWFDCSLSSTPTNPSGVYRVWNHPGLIKGLLFLPKLRMKGKLK
jgi:hypothetical protein